MKKFLYLSISILILGITCGSCQKETIYDTITSRDLSGNWYVTDIELDGKWVKVDPYNSMYCASIEFNPNTDEEVPFVKLKGVYRYGGTITGEQGYFGQGEGIFTAESNYDHKATVINLMLSEGEYNIVAYIDFYEFEKDEYKKVAKMQITPYALDKVYRVKVKKH